MKLIIQIPCYNEEKTLPRTLADLPKSIEGIDIVEFQIIDDGSTDRTIEMARQGGVHHIVTFKRNRGLAAAFKAGIDNALENKADILVNTDGDNQYQGKDIQKLVKPILEGKADIVIGCRPIADHPEFSFVKKILQGMGSWVLRKISNTTVRDAASGFRAYDRNAMLLMNIYSRFSYTMETLIQAGFNNLKVVGVDVDVNPKTRASRLFKNIFQFIWKQAKTIIAIMLLYHANWLFNFLSGTAILISIILVARYVLLVFFAGAPANAFWPSIIFAGVLLVVSFQLFLTGILASLISSNRRLMEDTNHRIKKLEINRMQKKES
jgi:glycosyltransferase involved in cell wall biosynthesis